MVSLMRAGVPLLLLASAWAQRQRLGLGACDTPRCCKRHRHAANCVNGTYSIAWRPSAPAGECGSRRAFIDLGANDGQSLRWFRSHRVMMRIGEAPYTTVIALEMNPAFGASLREELARMPGSVQTELLQAAAWVRDGSMEAQMQLVGSRTASKRGMLYNMTGSALRVGGVALNRAKDGRGRRAAKSPAAGSEAVTTVRTIDLGAFLSARFCAADYVHVKCDIEGAELEVFEHLLRTGVAPLIDELAVEWHLEKRATRAARLELRERQRKIVEGFAGAGVRLTRWEL